MADHQIVSEEALTAIASDIKTDIRTKADSSNVYTKSATDTLLEGKANTEGEYDGLTVGNAKQLVATVGEVDKVPYLFRTSGGAIDIGDRETDELVGGSVAFNQLTKNGNFSDGTTSWMKGNNVTSVSVSNNVATLVLTANQTYNKYLSQYLSMTAGHKYFVTCKATSDDVAISQFYVAVGAGSTLATICPLKSLSNNPLAWIANPTINSETIYFRFEDINVDHDVNATLANIMVIDLTAMFGATIADYIYSLEQATTGAGVAWFRSLFSKPYYAYNAGELMSVKASAHVTTGFNQVDENFEIGAISAQTGLPIDDNNSLRSRDFLPCLPNTNYCLTYKGDKNTSNMRVILYDLNKNVVDYWGFIINSPRVIRFDSKAYYFKVSLGNYGTTYNRDICINLSWDGERNGEYEPYEVNTYPLDSDLELRGIPKLDADNKLYYDGDTYSSDGAVSRRYGIVDLGLLDWSKAGLNDDLFATNELIGDIKLVDFKSQIFNAICYSFVSTTGFNVYTKAINKSIGIDENGRLYIYDSSKSTMSTAEFKAAMSGVYLVYELETPTTEQADAFQDPQVVDDFGTEEYIDNRAVAIPVGHNTFYEVNLRAKLEMSPDSPESNGDYLMRHTSEGNAYTPYVSPIPSLPSADGNYVLKCTVSGSTKTLTWVEET